ncbi:MAG TPA: hypothetical protein VNK03_05820 [Gammaproteobacteria bacterium]|nr:hypothetical protein [Gammaproteobacteria bacterium]
MDKRIKWSTDFKRYPEHKWPYKGLKGMGKAIVQVLLVLCAICALYALFYKTELNPGVIKSPEVEAIPPEVRVMD